MTITIQDLHFIKMNKSIKLYTVDMEKLVLNFQLTASFGNEYNNNNTYVNWIVENSIVNQITRSVPLIETKEAPIMSYMEL